MSGEVTDAAAVAPPGGGNLIRGTAESLLSRLEDNVNGEEQQQQQLEESELLQGSEPGPLPEEGRDVDDVLNVISQSINREAEGEKDVFTVFRFTDIDCTAIEEIF